MCKFCTCDALIQKYGKIVFLQIMISNVAFFTTIEFVGMCKKVLAMKENKRGQPWWLSS